MGSQINKIKSKAKQKVKQKIREKIKIKPVVMHNTGLDIVQLDCPYGASEAFRTAALAIKVKRSHENKWRHQHRMCRLFKGM